MTDELKLKMLVTCVDMADTYDEARQMAEYIITGEEPPTEEGDNLPDLHADLFKPSDFDKLFPNGIRAKFNIYPGGLTAQHLKEKEKATDPAADIYIIFKDGTYRPWSEVCKELDKLDTGEVASVGLQYKGHTFAVALHDIMSDETELLSKNAQVPQDSVFYRSMIDSLIDFDAKGNTEHIIKDYATNFGTLDDNQYIPTLGMSVVMYLMRHPLDDALEAVGGDKICKIGHRCWTSNELAVRHTLTVNFFSGYIDTDNSQYDKNYIRPVMDFKL